MCCHFMAWNFTVLVISRVGIAFAHAVFLVDHRIARHSSGPGNGARALSLNHRNGAGDGVRPADRRNGAGAPPSLPSAWGA